MPVSPRSDRPTSAIAAAATFDALMEARGRHLARVAGLDLDDGLRVLAAEYGRRGADGGFTELATTRIDRLMAAVAREEALELLAWYLAEGDVGLAPGGRTGGP